MLSINTYEPSNPSQEWRVKLNQIKSGYGLVGAAYANAQEGIYDDKEVGLFNGPNGSHVKIGKDGTIDIFASESLGIRLDPNTETLSIIAKKANINTQNFDIETNPIYFRFNSQPVDIDNFTVRPPKRGEVYSKEFKKLLKELEINE
jgi:hypothetical protein